MLAILTTHPIQYQVPLWQALAKDGRVPFEVWYLTNHGVQASHDREFGKSFAWDLNTLEGYPHRFLKVADGATPGSFWKCRLTEDLEQRIKEAGVKALWIQGWQVAAYWQAVWAAKRAGVQVWLRGESNDLAPIPFWKRGLKRMVLGKLFKRVDYFLYIGTANRRLYEKYGVPASKLHPAPYAVDNERFIEQANRIRDQKSEIRKKWGIAKDAFCVLFCGKFISKKRPMDVVEATRMLQGVTTDHGPRTTATKLHLLFVGSGELGAQLRDACHVVFDAENPNFQLSEFQPSTYQNTPPASFAGFLNQTEISKAYVAADCLVLPSDYGETWGLVVNEAMASGLPCVISDECGCAADLGFSPPNTIFSCGNVATLAEALAAITNGRQQMQDLDLVLVQNSIEATTRTVIRCYSSAG